MIARPSLPLPEPIRGVDPHSFAQFTLSERLPKIARRVLENHKWPSETRERLESLINSMPDGQLPFLLDDRAADKQTWERYLEPYRGQNWLQAPWFLSETYFFRQLIEATGFFRTDPDQNIDPYRAWKEEGLNPVLDGVSVLYERLDAFTAVHAPTDTGIQQTRLTHLLHMNIWGNQADLSLFPAESGKQPARPEADDLTSHLLIDNAASTSEYLTTQPKRPSRVDIVLDNGGLELAYDLALADFLLQNQFADTVILHAKPYPTYVSDATKRDVADLIGYLMTSHDRSACGLADRLERAIARGSLSLKDNFYWTSPLSGWDMTADVRLDLQDSDLIISKGDANYRRWLGDRHWPFTTPLDDILNYTPAPLVNLRVFKSNCLAGLKPGQAEQTEKKDQDWLYNGNWGVIQLAGLPHHDELP